MNQDGKTNPGQDDQDPCEGCGSVNDEHAERCREVCAHEWPSDIHEEGGDHYCPKCGADGLA